MKSSMPTHDAKGLHILDPNDHLGHKSAYITRLQERLLRRYLPSGHGELAVDLGCGFGRLTPVMSDLGWRTIGIDPAEELINYAREQVPGTEFKVGALPDLPLDHGCVSLLLLQNVMRALKMMGKLDAVTGIGRYLTPNGQLFIVDNIRAGHPDYLPEAQIIDLMAREDLHLLRRIPLRAGRWWMIYLIRYGLIPTKWFGRIADWELDRMAKQSGSPRWQYWNVLYVFKH
jgi:SAM-dependent methyltransferase